MKLARFWTRDHGEAIGPDGPVRVVARGWSDDSLDAARAKAREVAQRVAQRIVSSAGKQDRYPYGDRPLPEPVIREIAGSVVTRNSYGALVLNADRMMFIDIDREDAQPSDGSASGIVSGILALFGKKPEPAPAKPDPEMDAIRRIAERHNLTGRAYKTAAGYRVLVTNSAFQADSTETAAILKDFGSDPLYIRLCRLQESFRARLTPKPWRCDFHQPRVTFPFDTPRAEAEFRSWESEYNSKAAGYATCRFLATFGGGSTEREFEPLIEYHDRETKAASGLPLA